MSVVLEAYGLSVRSSDLCDWGYGETGIDFLLSDYACDHIVTNPPFILAEQFVRHALTQARYKVALLCKLSFLESKRRKELFSATPLRSVYVFSERVTMLKNGLGRGDESGMQAYAWYVWERGYNGKPVLDWI